MDSLRCQSNCILQAHSNLSRCVRRHASSKQRQACSAGSCKPLLPSSVLLGTWYSTMYLGHAPSPKRYLRTTVFNFFFGGGSTVHIHAQEWPSRCRKHHYRRSRWCSPLPTTLHQKHDPLPMDTRTATDGGVSPQQRSRKGAGIPQSRIISALTSVSAALNHRPRTAGRSYLMFDTCLPTVPLYHPAESRWPGGVMTSRMPYSGLFMYSIQ